MVNEKSMTQNDPKKTQNDPKRPKKKPPTKSEFQCIYCQKPFSTKAHQRRHELHRCKHNININTTNILKAENKNLQKKHEKEKKMLYKHIENLLEKVGDTINNNISNINNINQTNNIVLNNYGNEDLSHITTNVLDKLILQPYQMINNLTKMIHFNQEKPENMNIYIPNKKQKYIKIFKDNKWILEEKKQRIPDIVDKNYNIIDNYYENCDNDNSYENYQKKMDDKEQSILQQEYDNCELEIINNTKNVINTLKLNQDILPPPPTKSEDQMEC